MTADTLLARLCELGVEIDPRTAAVVRPAGFAGGAALADLLPALREHRAAVLAALPPWACGPCGRLFFAPQAEVTEFGGGPDFCAAAACPQRGA